MTKKFFPALILFLVTVLSSCIADEPLNMECDIVAVDSVWMEKNAAVLHGNPTVSNNSVTIWVKQGTNRSAFAPEFIVTEGASLTCLLNGQEVPANGTLHDFSAPQIYKVTSEDGQWSKHYTVSFAYPSVLNHLGFEHVGKEADKERFCTWYEIDAADTENPERNYWATGNPGYAMCGLARSEQDYPTYAAEDGVVGKCLKLTTQATGLFGKRFRMPIAAGNIFIGHFETKIATSAPRTATEFGLQLVTRQPERLEGYYKYNNNSDGLYTDHNGKQTNPDGTFTDHNGAAVAGRVDTCDIYAVVFEVDPNDFKPLSGDSILTSERIVLMARIDNPGEPEEWKHFSEPFLPRNGKVFSQEKADRSEYAITVVFTSSRDGAYFRGTVGSTLYVDEVDIVWKE